MRSSADSMRRVVTVLIAVCLFQVYVVGARAAADSATPSARTYLPAGEMTFGRLSIDEDRSILVNGNSAISGTTIFSGSQIQTTQDDGATVRIGAASLYVRPDSDVLIDFDNAHINVKVAAGGADVTAPAEISYSISTPDGKLISNGDAAADTPLPPSSGMSKKKKTAIIIAIAAAAIFVPLCIAECNEDESNSR